jgi:hypothetical protein
MAAPAYTPCNDCIVALWVPSFKKQRQRVLRNITAKKFSSNVFKIDKLLALLPLNIDCCYYVLPLPQ